MDEVVANVRWETSREKAGTLARLAAGKTIGCQVTWRHRRAGHISLLPASGDGLKAR